MGTRLINVLAGLLVHSRKHLDTQCGLKVFERSVAQEVFERCRVERFGFDAEVLLLLDRMGIQPVEVPVDVLPQVRESRGECCARRTGDSERVDGDSKPGAPGRLRGGCGLWAGARWEFFGEDT